ncbi:hypothetical protein HPP92_023325 [Vanilla planifolia]|uniref:Uncharacterized protein n=1 Tax=Vanilla planifolia TaxID=51239 RepID=A0A835Q2E8_VANPL|nr:hypothetical protein HPP92_023325 [Vanilla planifolia]
MVETCLKIGHHGPKAKSSDEVSAADHALSTPAVSETELLKRSSTEQSATRDNSMNNLTGKQWVTALHSSIALLQEIQTVAESQRDEGGEGSKWKQPMTLPRGQPLATTRQHNRRWFVHPDLIHPSRPPNHWLVVSIDPEYCTDLGAYNSDGEAKSTLHFTCERYTSACLISAGVAEFSFSLSWLFACLGLLVAQDQKYITVKQLRIKQARHMTQEDFSNSGGKSMSMRVCARKFSVELGLRRRTSSGGYTLETEGTEALENHEEQDLARFISG